MKNDTCQRCGDDLMIQKAKELLDKYGILSSTFLCCKLHCTRQKAIEIMNKLCPEQKMDHSLPLHEFIEKYRHRIEPPRKINMPKHKKDYI